MNSPDAAPPDTEGRDTRTAADHGVPGVFPAASDVPPGWSVPWPDPPSPEDERFDRLVGIVTATCTLAGVSLLAVWLWGPGPSPARNQGTDLASARRTQPARPDSTVSAASRGKTSSVRETAELRTRLVSPDALGSTAVLARNSERRREPRPETEASPTYTSRAAMQVQSPPLLVLSQPQGARVTINGVGYGSTPAKIPYLPPGPKRIRVTMDGFDTEERFFGAETSMSGATLRIVMRETPMNWRATDSPRDLDPSERQR